MIKIITETVELLTDIIIACISLFVIFGGVVVIINLIQNYHP